MKKITTLLISVVLLIMGCTANPPVDGRYALYVPKAHSNEPLPLLIYLHGKGERGDSPEELTYVRGSGPLQYIDAGHELPFIIVAPQLSKHAEYWDIPFVNAVIKDVQSKYNIDESRLYLTGNSMGGYGTWYLGLSYPTRFAALAPIAGGDIFQYNIPGIGDDITTLCKLSKTPIWVAHGQFDTVVPIAEADRLVQQLNRCHANVKYSVFEDLAHVMWDELYQNEQFYQWLLAQKLD